ncbi:BfmA/BtgA family mobilization protein [Aquimarina hainanensis]|uniref:BfmA/BtgA family mobilization protein n=2 Tax=Aquimarina hainanensis TaxID=1578017 RepID=A0ABW5N9H9_9FLAO
MKNIKMMKKSIVINGKSHKDLKNLSDEFNRPIGKFTEDMILFFKKTGQDPALINDKTPSQMIKVIDRRIVGFFRTQESEILYPLRSSLSESIEQNTTFFKNLLENLNSIFGKVKENDLEVKESIKRINDSLETIKSNLK